MRQIAIGTFDNFNVAVAGVKGAIAGPVALIYESLTTQSLDEVSTEYGLLAEAVSYPEDFSSVTYRLRANARWHDGKPVTPDDVIFSLDAFKQYHPQYSAYYRHVVKAEKVGERDVRFTFDAPGNRELPQIVGQLTVLPKHWWEGTDAEGSKRDISQTTLEKPLGSGPYRIKDFVAGRIDCATSASRIIGAATSTSRSAATISTNCVTNISATAPSRSKPSRAIRSTGAPRTAPRTGRRPTTFRRSVKSGCLLEEFPNRSSGIMQAFAFNIRRDKFKDARVRRALNLRVRFRGNEQADFLRPVQAHRELFRRHRTGVERSAAGQGA